MSPSALRWRGELLRLRWRSLGDDRGAVFVEYLIVVGVVALLAIHAFSVFGTKSSTVVRQEGADVAKLGF
jgi:hypothetical protein